MGSQDPFLHSFTSTVEEFGTTRCGTFETSHCCSTKRAGDAFYLLDRAIPFTRVGVSRARQYAAFLDIDTRSSSSSSGHHNGAATKARPADPSRPTAFTSIQGTFGMKLGPVKLRLMYQTPEIYMADIADFDKKTRAHKFACKFSDKEPAMPHPEIRFKSYVRFAKFKLTDMETNEVLLDAVYPAGMVPKIGGMYVKGTAVPDPLQSPKPMMQKICIPSWDPGPHLFDLSVCTRDHYYEDQMDTPHGEAEGFDNLGGSCAHVGVEAYRQPELETKPKEGKYPKLTGKSKLAKWKWSPKGSFSPGGASMGDIHYYDPLERITNKEVNILEDEVKQDDGRQYYDWIYTKSGREHNNYEYLFKIQPPQLVTEHKFVPGEGKKPKEGKKPPKPVFK